MLHRQRIIRMQIHQLMDACLFALSFWLAFELRSNSHVVAWLQLQPAPPEDSFFWLILILIPAGSIILEWQGFYDRPILAPRRAFLLPLLRASIITTAALTLILFFMQIPFARTGVVWFGFIAFALIWAKEELLRGLYQSGLGRLDARRRLLVVGSPTEVERIRAHLERHPELDVEMVLALDLNNTPPERLVEALHEHAINAVMLSARHTYLETVQAAICACEREGVEAWLVADLFHTQIARAAFDDFFGWPVLVFRSAPEMSWPALAKSLLDFIGAAFFLLVSSALLLVVAVIIKLSSRGPVLFRQQRAGLNGRPFTIYKFRTMVTNAEQLKHELAALNEMSGPVFKLTNDPRVTPIGRWLRKFSLDEFPQFFNVLRGDMSLVGPRPLPVAEVARFDDMSHRRRLSMKPGLTCLWQVSGRNDVKDFCEWVRLDLEYIDHWSLWLDLKILACTVPVVLLGKGAK